MHRGTDGQCFADWLTDRELSKSTIDTYSYAAKELVKEKLDMESLSNLIKLVEARKEVGKTPAYLTFKNTSLEYDILGNLILEEVNYLYDCGTLKKLRMPLPDPTEESEGESGTNIIPAIWHKKQ